MNAYQIVEFRKMEDQVVISAIHGDLKNVLLLYKKMAELGGDKK